VVRIYNERGACLAGAVVSDDVLPDVVQMATGAWYDPADPNDPQCLEVHGNPNVLTLDVGSSRLAQGPSAQTVLVEIERYAGPLPPIRAFDPPAFASAPGGDVPLPGR
jgi:biotin/methionine sulfoxide reductase